jgi:hypothetical protein
VSRLDSGHGEACFYTARLNDQELVSDLHSFDRTIIYRGATFNTYNDPYANRMLHSTKFYDLEQTELVPVAFGPDIWIARLEAVAILLRKFVNWLIN